MECVVSLPVPPSRLRKPGGNRLFVAAMVAALVAPALAGCSKADAPGGNIPPLTIPHPA